MIHATNHINERQRGTRVKNPCARSGVYRYLECPDCGMYYTQLGYIRHRQKCKANHGK